MRRDQTRPDDMEEVETNRRVFCLPTSLPLEPCKRQIRERAKWRKTEMCPTNRNGRNRDGMQRLSLQVRSDEVYDLATTIHMSVQLSRSRRKIQIKSS
jgi:hypothetical protein